jgi:recombination protein RecR
MIHLLQNRDSHLEPLLTELQRAHQEMKSCTTCGNLDLTDPCHICRHPARDTRTLCVVEGVADLWALERNSAFKGLFHVLGGNLSALDGVGPEDLRIKELMQRVQENTVDEVILALNATIDGQTTAHYVADLLKETGVRITAIAHGVPVGGELDYLDEGTLTTALHSRRAL